MEGEFNTATSDFDDLAEGVDEESEEDTTPLFDDMSEGDTE